MGGGGGGGGYNFGERSLFFCHKIIFVSLAPVSEVNNRMQHLFLSQQAYLYDVISPTIQ